MLARIVTRPVIFPPAPHRLDYFELGLAARITPDVVQLIANIYRKYATKRIFKYQNLLYTGG